MPVCGWRVATSGSVMKRPPSRGHVLSAGSRDMRGGLSTICVIGPLPRSLAPTRASDASNLRLAHSFPSVGGISSSGSRATSAIKRSGQRPKARSTRDFVPKRLVTSGKSQPRTRRNESAGPPAAITRRWISATSSSQSTSASIVTSSPAWRSPSRKTRRSAAEEVMSGKNLRRVVAAGSGRRVGAA